MKGQDLTTSKGNAPGYRGSPNLMSVMCNRADRSGRPGRPIGPIQPIQPIQPMQPDRPIRREDAPGRIGGPRPGVRARARFAAVFLLLLSVLICVRAAPVSALSNGDCERYLKTSPEFAGADRTLASTWKTVLSSLKGRDRQALISNQEAWVREGRDIDAGLYVLQGMEPAEACARATAEREEALRRIGVEQRSDDFRKGAAEMEGERLRFEKYAAQLDSEYESLLMLDPDPGSADPVCGVVAGVRKLDRTVMAITLRDFEGRSLGTFHYAEDGTAGEDATCRGKVAKNRSICLEPRADVPRIPNVDALGLRKKSVRWVRGCVVPD